jgi:YD repeat-containing protein
MQNFMLRQEHSLGPMAQSAIMFRIRQIGALLCMIGLLTFGRAALGSYPVDVYPKIRFAAQCIYGSNVSDTAQEAVNKCAAAMIANGYTAASFSVGAQLPYTYDTMNGEPTYRKIDGSYTIGNTTYTCGNCGTILATYNCPTLSNGAQLSGSIISGSSKDEVIICPNASQIPEDRGPQRRCPADKPVNNAAPNILTQLFGNPIDAATGVKIQPEVDYSGPDGLVFERTYRSSLGQFASILNSGWTQPQLSNSPFISNNAACMDGLYSTGTQTSSYCFPYARTGQSSGLYIYSLKTTIGQSLVFTDVNGTGIPIAKADTNIQVIKNTDATTQGVWLWEFILEDDSHERYNSQGQLVARWPHTGEALKTVYTYSDASTPASTAPRLGLLIRVTNAFGRSLNFTYNLDGQMVNMTDPNGGIYTYAYDLNNNLTQVTYPDDTPDVASDNPKRIYLYEDSRFPHALTGITDEAGTPPYATFQYEAQNLNDTRGRAISTEHAGAVEKYTFAYNTDGSTTVTDPLNTPRTYTYTTLLGVKRVTGMTQPCATCGSSAASTTYDANGNVASRTDFNGTQTTYAYDLTRNLETSRIEAVGTPEQRTITTEWHPAYRLPVRIAEPNRRTTFVYHGDTVVNGTTTTTLTCGATGALCRKTVQATNDANGGQGFSPTPTGTRTWNYTYNSRGQILTVNGPRGDMNDVTSHTYYAANDPVVDNRKLLKTVTNALGQITTYNTYDAHGRPTRITDPNGVVTDLVYDARGRLTNLTRGGLTTTLAYTSYGALWKVTTPAAGTVTYGYDNAHRLTSITNGASEKIVYTLDNQGNRTKEQTFAADGTVAATLNRQFDALGRLWKILNKDNTGNPGIRLRCRGQPDR